MPHLEPTVVFALALATGVVCQALARHLQVPSIALLFAAGVALGPDGLGLIQPRILGEGLFGLVSLAVAVILFEGGLSLDLRRLRRQDAAIRGLLTVGVLVTAAGATAAVRLALGWSWGVCLIYGTLVVVTGPTVIRPLLRNVPLRPRLATVLEAEGVFNDAIGAILVAVVLQAVLGPATGTLASGVLDFAARVAFGAAAGLSFGFGLRALLDSPRAIPRGLENVVTLGLVLGFFELCETVLHETGILAAVLAGVVVGNAESRVQRDLQAFKEDLTTGFVALLFVLLAADVRLADVAALGGRGWLPVAALALVVRPVAVGLATVGSRLRWNERAFLAWVAPKGIVAAAVASLAASTMEREGLPGGTELRALVFLTIAATVVVQGGSGGLAARLLRVRAPGREAYVILGAEGLGLLLGRVLRSGGSEVVFIDTRPANVRRAEELGFRVVYGNALDARVLTRARPERASALVGASLGGEANALFAGEAERAGVPGSYVALDRSEAGVTPGVLEGRGARVLFDRPKDLEQWESGIRHGEVAVQVYRFERPDDDAGAPARGSGAPSRALAGRDAHVVLALQRGAEGDESWSPMHAGLQPEPGDRAAVAVHRPGVERAERDLARQGWRPVLGAPLFDEGD